MDKKISVKRLRDNRVTFMLTNDELKLINELTKEKMYDNRSELFRNEFLRKLVKNNDGKKK